MSGDGKIIRLADRCPVAPIIAGTRLITVMITVMIAVMIAVAGAACHGRSAVINAAVWAANRNAAVINIGVGFNRGSDNHRGNAK
jgi:hypothetical protein